MKKITNLGCILFMFLGLISQAQTASKTSLPPTTNSHNWQVDVNKIVSPVASTMYGVFFEDINFAADGGLYAEMVKNRGFEFDNPFMGWIQPNTDRHSLNLTSGVASIVKVEESPANRNVCRVLVHDDKNYSLINEGFRGMGIKQYMEYKLSFNAKLVDGSISKIIFQIVSEDEAVLAQTTVSVSGNAWKPYKATMKANQKAMKAKLKISFVGSGNVDLDMVSLFPADTWKNREKGLRSDLVQLLFDLQPGFLRFPGGCIVEGRTLAQRYQWKKTVGPVDQREPLINRWNTEFNHRLTPDYFQSFGLGFYEYFQLSEDLGAEPLPILSCGMACQFNTGELVPMDELDPYIQDAVDLIEFANGSTDTKWGKLRSDMGHPATFNLKYIGIGNEQWGPEYFKRYDAFDKAIKAKYPNIIIVSGSGPFPDGEHFEYGTEELAIRNAEIVDEHYYRPPAWFKENATRYDSYDRKGPKIFAGEYAAQSVAIASPDNKNNWNCALSEAAFMTGLERNADLVVMTSYAPLMAHAEGWQWTPDMIWFNNLEAYGTANYYVQKMYANNRGTDLIHIFEDGKKITGQDDIYATTVLDRKTNEIIVKVVNTSKQKQEFNIELMGSQLGSTAQKWLMGTDDLEAVNSFEQAQKISPNKMTILIKDGKLQDVIPSNSFAVYRSKLTTK